MENKYLEQARTTLGAELAVLEKKCYDRGYNDAQLGRPRSARRQRWRLHKAPGASTVRESTPDVAELAHRAAKLPRGTIKTRQQGNDSGCSAVCLRGCRRSFAVMFKKNDGPDERPS